MNAHKLSLGLLPVLLTLLLVAPALGGAPGTARYDFRVTDMPSAGLRQPTLDRDNTMYVGGDDANVYAINPDGTIKWIYYADSPVTTNAAIYYSPDGQNAQYDGTIYVGLQDGRVLALDVTGNPEWRFDAGSPINASPALAADGTIYVGKEPSVLVAITPDGDEKWSRTIPDSEEGIYDPVVGPDGTIYFGTRDGDYFHAHNPDGTQKWITGVPHVLQGVQSGAAIGRDGTIYFASAFALTALWPNGIPKWRRSVGQFGDVHATPVIGHDGTIYVSADALIAINPDSSVEWVFWGGPGAPPTPVASAAVDSNGLIYFPATDGRIYCVAPGGTQVWRYFAVVAGTRLSASVIGGDGLAYSTGVDYVRALYTGATGPFDGPWPMYRHDAQCTARLDKYWYMMSDLKDLLTLVADADLSTRIKKTLTVKAKSAMQSLERGHIVPVKNKLGAFINHVEALEGKKISVELADVLIRHALAIMEYDGD